MSLCECPDDERDWKWNSGDPICLNCDRFVHDHPVYMRVPAEVSEVHRREPPPSNQEKDSES